MTFFSSLFFTSTTQPGLGSPAGALEPDLGLYDPTFDFVRYPDFATKKSFNDLDAHHSRLPLARQRACMAAV